MLHNSIPPTNILTTEFATQLLKIAQKFENKKKAKKAQNDQGVIDQETVQTHNPPAPIKRL